MPGLVQVDPEPGGDLLVGGVASEREQAAADGVAVGGLALGTDPGGVEDGTRGERSDPCYSAANATLGSTRVARRAGIHEARAVAASNRVGTSTQVAGSDGAVS